MSGRINLSEICSKKSKTDNSDLTWERGNDGETVPLIVNAQRPAYNQENSEEVESQRLILNQARTVFLRHGKYDSRKLMANTISTVYL